MTQTIHQNNPTNVSENCKGKIYDILYSPIGKRNHEDKQQTTAIITRPKKNRKGYF